MNLFIRPVVVGRALAAGALTVGLVLPGMAAVADDEPLTVDTLPSMTDAEIDAHRTHIDIPDIQAVDVPDIVPFEPEVSSADGRTTVSLDTDVLFEFGKAELGDSARDAVADAVEDVPDGAEVTVVGHTDSVGSTSDNLALSKKRAQAVADVLGEKRSDLRLRVSGKGEIQPVEPNSSGGKDNPDGREKNRRVEIRYRG